MPIDPELLERGYAQTMEEWWELLLHHWNSILVLANSFNLKDVVWAMEASQRTRDALPMYRALQSLWERLPDQAMIHDFSGFGPLCDLCSDFPYGKVEKEKEQLDLPEEGKP